MPTEHLRGSAPTGDIRRSAQTRFGDAGIAELAEQQHGVVSRSQLCRLGLSEDAINRRLRLRRLHRVHHGVYAVGHKVISQEGRWMAGVLAFGHESVLSHRSAAALWRIQSSGGEVAHV